MEEIILQPEISFDVILQTPLVSQANLVTEQSENNVTPPVELTKGLPTLPYEFADLVEDLKSIPLPFSEKSSLQVEEIFSVLPTMKQVAQSTVVKIAPKESSHTVMDPSPTDSKAEAVPSEVPSIKDIIKLFHENKNACEFDKVTAVNDFFNRFNYYRDLAHWGIRDYWATPLEFITSGGGDCEDFALVKYFSLIDLGVPEEKLFLTHVNIKGEGHMVLTYYSTPYAVPLVLDNVETDIIPLDQRHELKPVYSVNSHGVWLATAMGLGEKVSAATDFKPWIEFQQRLHSGKDEKRDWL